MPAGPPDSICFVRSHAILESTQLDRDSVERLRAAVAIVSAAAGAPCVVVDRDGLATSQSPFVLYANPSCDLTVAVQAAYLNLQAGGNGIEELGKADQATPPQPP